MEPSSVEFQPNRIENAPELDFDYADKSVASEGHPDKNDDSLIVDSRLHLIGIFDGMSRPPFGHIASKIARDTFGSFLSEKQNITSVDQSKEIIKEALMHANEAVRQDIDKNPFRKGMGTTASVVKIVQSPDNKWTAIIGNVGDSRVYIMREDGNLEQITLDDNNLSESNDEAKARDIQKKLNNVIDLNTLSPIELAYFHTRNILNQSIGDPVINAHIYTADLQSRNKIIVTSDGIHDNLTDEEMEDIVRDSTDSQMAVDKLIEAARVRSRGSHLRAKSDDISAIIVNVSEKSTETPRTQQSVPYDAEQIPEDQSPEDPDQTVFQDEVPDQQQTEAEPATESPVVSKSQENETEEQKKERLKEEFKKWKANNKKIFDEMKYYEDHPPHEIHYKGTLNPEICQKIDSYRNEVLQRGFTDSQQMVESQPTNDPETHGAMD